MWCKCLQWSNRSTISLYDSFVKANKTVGYIFSCRGWNAVTQWHENNRFFFNHSSKPVCKMAWTFHYCWEASLTCCQWEVTPGWIHLILQHYSIRSISVPPASLTRLKKPPLNWFLFPQIIDLFIRLTSYSSRSSFTIQLLVSVFILW